MVKKLIINADDFGLCDGVSLGILTAHKKGILTSTTCMMNMPDIRYHLEIAKNYPDLGLGVHLNITAGPALTANSFSDENGHFFPRNHYPDFIPVVNKDELYNEWKAQIERFIAMTGHMPTHLDSHHHIHLLPDYLPVALKLASEYHLPIRQEQYVQKQYEDVRFAEIFYNDTVSLQTIADICQFKDEIFEMMCHPAFVDKYLYAHSSYHLKRTDELEILCCDEVKDLTSTVELINYSQIKKVK